MKKSLFSILLAIIVPFTVIITILIIIFTVIKISVPENQNIETFDRYTVLKIENNGVINVEENINIKVKKDCITFSEFELALSNKKFYKDGTSSYNTNSLPVNVTASVNGKELETYIKDDNIFFDNINCYQGKDYNFSLSYNYNISEYVFQFDDATIIPLNHINNYSKHIVRVVLPEKTDNVSYLKYNKNKKSQRIEDYTHELELTKDLSEGWLVLENGIIKNSIVIEGDHLNIIIPFFEENQGLLENLIILFTISITCLCIIAILRNGNKVEKIYNRSTENLLDPILAEAVIDRKIGIKELIMTCIANLVKKGNIEFLDNDKFKLLNFSKVHGYELKITSMLFEREGDIISFEKINNMFTKENIRTKKFYNFFKDIKQSINKELFSQDIYDKSGEMCFKTIQLINKIVFLDVLVLTFLVPVTSISNTITTLFFVTIFSFLFVIFNYKFAKQIAYKKEKKHEMSWLICASIIFFFPHIYFSYVNIVCYILAITLLLLNIIINKFANTHLLTKKGIEMYKKIYGLKIYIEDYSMMEKREMEHYILWDDYLTYAIAFGISNNVTKRFGENIMNVNIGLQNIKAFLEL